MQAEETAFLFPPLLSPDVSLPSGAPGSFFGRMGRGGIKKMDRGWSLKVSSWDRKKQAGTVPLLTILESSKPFIHWSGLGQRHTCSFYRGRHTGIAARLAYDPLHKALTVELNSRLPRHAAWITPFRHLAQLGRISEGHPLMVLAMLPPDDHAAMISACCTTHPPHSAVGELPQPGNEVQVSIIVTGYNTFLCLLSSGYLCLATVHAEAERRLSPIPPDPLTFRILHFRPPFTNTAANTNNRHMPNSYPGMPSMTNDYAAWMQPAWRRQVYVKLFLLENGKAPSFFHIRPSTNDFGPCKWALEWSQRWLVSRWQQRLPPEDILSAFVPHWQYMYLLGGLPLTLSDPDLGQHLGFKVQPSQSIPSSFSPQPSQGLSGTRYTSCLDHDSVTCNFMPPQSRPKLQSPKCLGVRNVDHAMTTAVQEYCTCLFSFGMLAGGPERSIRKESSAIRMPAATGAVLSCTATIQNKPANLLEFGFVSALRCETWERLITPSTLGILVVLCIPKTTTRHTRLTGHRFFIEADLHTILVQVVASKRIPRRLIQVPCRYSSPTLATLLPLSESYNHAISRPSAAITNRMLSNSSLFEKLRCSAPMYIYDQDSSWCSYLRASLGRGRNIQVAFSLTHSSMRIDALRAPLHRLDSASVPNAHVFGYIMAKMNSGARPSVIVAQELCCVEIVRIGTFAALQVPRRAKMIDIHHHEVGTWPTAAPAKQSLQNLSKRSPSVLAISRLPCNTMIHYDIHPIRAPRYVLEYAKKWRNSYVAMQNALRFGDAYMCLRMPSNPTKLRPACGLNGRSWLASTPLDCSREEHAKKNSATAQETFTEHAALDPPLGPAQHTWHPNFKLFPLHNHYLQTSSYGPAATQIASHETDARSVAEVNNLVSSRRYTNLTVYCTLIHFVDSTSTASGSDLKKKTPPKWALLLENSKLFRVPSRHYGTILSASRNAYYHQLRDTNSKIAPCMICTDAATTGEDCHRRQHTNDGLHHARAIAPSRRSTGYSIFTFRRISPDLDLYIEWETATRCSACKRAPFGHRIVPKLLLSNMANFEGKAQRTLNRIRRVNCYASAMTEPQQSSIGRMNNASRNDRGRAQYPHSWWYSKEKFPPHATMESAYATRIIQLISHFEAHQAMSSELAWPSAGSTISNSPLPSPMMDLEIMPFPTDVPALRNVVDLLRMEMKAAKASYVTDNYSSSRESRQNQGRRLYRLRTAPPGLMTQIRKMLGILTPKAFGRQSIPHSHRDRPSRAKAPLLAPRSRKMLESEFMTIQRTQFQIVYTGCTFSSAILERFEKSMALGGSAISRRLLETIARVRRSSWSFSPFAANYNGSPDDDESVSRDARCFRASNRVVPPPRIEAHLTLNRASFFPSAISTLIATHHLSLERTRRETRLGNQRGIASIQPHCFALWKSGPLDIRERLLQHVLSFPCHPPMFHGPAFPLLSTLIRHLPAPWPGLMSSCTGSQATKRSNMSPEVVLKRKKVDLVILSQDTLSQDTCCYHRESNADLAQDAFGKRELYHSTMAATSD
ncbi:uncharacterized protein MYCFIDRAFT_173235 [Pseudocercospora fijiensis CIRAD86]|uniref:Uncharacterized protein n=1 Tax=Pseudocercospora fijiensis (strain CIRAD86) TaxID=383855 RepID=M2Z2X9_PSEFD|nr:uncharacterized protein MYCFIDRAFT_173235 [Pseudocercospora fijiensis CIRAD86]EME84200.1 hypothetical protein MYCFIDRAFT_173235 [Pseudocercospora fijiensis CIRAD86]